MRGFPAQNTGGGAHCLSYGRMDLLDHLTRASTFVVAGFDIFCQSLVRWLYEIYCSPLLPPVQCTPSTLYETCIIYMLSNLGIHLCFIHFAFFRAIKIPFLHCCHSSLPELPVSHSLLLF